MFFTVGFALGINSYLVPLVQSALNTSSGVSYMIVAATFSAFFIFSYPSSRIIARIGYRKTMSLSFFVFALAFALFIPSAHMASLPLFLLASFMSGVGNTMLQAAINPYVTILGPLESAAKRISIMGICNALAWPAAPLFLSAVIGKEISAAVLTDVDVPFYIIIAVFLALGVIMNFAPLQEVKAEGEDEDAPDSAYASGKTSIWQFPHLVLGALSLFVYVGVETLALTTTVDYATSLGLDNAESYAIWPSIGMALGYVIGILTIPKYMSQVTALRICTWIAVVGSLAVVLTPPAVSIWCVSFLSLACSLMYPSIWPLAIADLGKFTKTGSALLVMSIGGGALIPLVFGFLKDMTGNQNAYWICLPFYLIIMYYSYYGYRIRK
ncbi:MAG: sugar MFS transporter [Bacteroidales bacterium]|nr:sugar MFS transporter [Bacteroidales bacterium]